VQFFLFLHTFEIHAPYLHLAYARPLLSDSQRAKVAELAAAGRNLKTNADLRLYLKQQGLLRKEVTSALYDGGIRYVDEHLIGALVGELEAAGIDRDTIIVITSDHGEEFGEHRPEAIYGSHGGNLYDTLVRVPLIIHAPGETAGGRVIRDQVRSIDIAPTILDLLDVPIPDEMEGRSLVPLMRGSTTAPPPPAISEATSQGPEWKSIRDGRYKLLYVVDTGNTDQSPRVGLQGEPVREYLFDVAADPLEQTDLARQQSDKRSQLGAELRASLRQFADKDFGESKGEALDDTVMERLRALGYVE
jgi:arylsulfatase A-like enzyme